MTDSTLQSLREFAAAVTAKTRQHVAGAREEQLRAPFETLMAQVGTRLGRTVVCSGESTLPDQLGRPDFAVHADGILTGFAELKAPGKGADTSRFRGHDRKQSKRFAAIPNLLYSDGNQWALYRTGQMVGELVQVDGDVSRDGRRAVAGEDAVHVEALMRDFLAWEPTLATDATGRTDLRRFAAEIAPLCRMLRENVVDSLLDEDSPLSTLQQDWRKLLFPEASGREFADAYAQIVTFALLLARSEGADPLNLTNARQHLAVGHSLLSRVLEVLTDLLGFPDAPGAISASLDLILRVIGTVPVVSLESPSDPWLYFYEDFLAAYDPELRKDAGVYYTPVEVVQAQVKLVDELLVQELGRPYGFASNDVVVLDPAVGTGTYLLSIIAHALSRMSAEQGQGALPSHATTLANNLNGFELMAGPYAVAELRISRALRDHGADLQPSQGPRIYLSDTLESPHADPPQMGMFYRPITEQRSRALEVKADVPVLTCIGNPPYDRHPAPTKASKATTGGWVRWGDEGAQADPILKDFLEPAKAAGQGVHLKNLYNLYVYFWRWALWKVFEHDSARGAGVVSFITASSYLDGPAFCGMREHLRRLCDEIWILDLGGEGRALPHDDNVFDIITPVAIGIALRRRGTSECNVAGRVRYASVQGSRAEKLKILTNIGSFSDVSWTECPNGFQDAFRPSESVHIAASHPSGNLGVMGYARWPLLKDIFPWQHSGMQAKRTWPICPDKTTLKKRWKSLLEADDRAVAFREERDRKIAKRYITPMTGRELGIEIARLPRDAPMPNVQRYAYRSFDRQWVIADGRLISYPRRVIWCVHSRYQTYLTSLLTQPIGNGPALTAAAVVPDLHHFSGRGAKDTIPMYRSDGCSHPNLDPAALEAICSALESPVSAEDLFSYTYGALAHYEFTSTFAEQLKGRELRVPVTTNSDLFDRVKKVGERLLWLHTYGQRFIPNGFAPGQIPSGSARWERSIPVNFYPSRFDFNHNSNELSIGKGLVSGVAANVFGFQVSGRKVVESWLNYRMKDGAGKKLSPLDKIRPERWSSEFTSELLELLWVLEHTLAESRRQAKLLQEIVASDCILASDLPPVPPDLRMAPRLQFFQGVGL